MNRYPVLATLIPALSLPVLAHAQTSQTVLPVVVVTGKFSEHYRVDTVDSLGPLGSTPLLDTPYS
ncbi:MAG: hypothetical protein ABIP38_00720, partial [Steroidobacteraceae bacterium]